MTKNKIHRHLLPGLGLPSASEIKRPQVHELLDTVAGKGLTTGVNRSRRSSVAMFTVALDRISSTPIRRRV